MATNSRLGLDYKSKVRGVHPEWLVGYFPLDEKQDKGTACYDWSTQNNHGTYTAVTPRDGLGADGTRNAPYFDGSTSLVDLYSAGIAADISLTEFSVMAWFRVKNNGVWGDTTVRRILTIGANATTNVILLEKTATANTLRAAYIAGSTTKSVSPTVYESLDTRQQWVCFGMSGSATNDALKIYINGAQSGTTQSSLGTWSGSLASTLCVIGSSASTAADVWSGWLQHVVVWNNVLADADFEYLYKRAG